MLRPTDEQEKAIELFRSGENLRIDAYAGSGKTTTLRLLAESTPKAGRYVAFNKSIAKAAKGTFPSATTCGTTHNLSHGTIKAAYGFSTEKMGGNAFPNQIANALKLPREQQFSLTLPFALSDCAFAAILKDSCTRFMHSDDEEPDVKHFPHHGRLGMLEDDEFWLFAEQSLPKLRELWETMINPQRTLPLGHDGYMKLWALSDPPISGDYVLVDEAQDSNPVLLQVLKKQSCQIVYVGDPYQQIYEWRGAVNAMERVDTRHRCALTQSFRFGATIADAATRVIAKLGAKDAIRGSPNVQSHIGDVYPEAILARTNFGVISNLIGYLEVGADCHVLRGTDELKRLLSDVEKLKRGVPGEAPEFFGFSKWDDVLNFSVQPEGEYLKGFVRLVSTYGEAKLLYAVGKSKAEEQDADIVLSTAHKAKGREWNTVCLDEDFDKSVPLAALTTSADASGEIKNKNFQAEARILYVALTRAKQGVTIPPGVMSFFGLTKTSDERQGIPRNMPGLSPAVPIDFMDSEEFAEAEARLLARVETVTCGCCGSDDVEERGGRILVCRTCGGPEHF